VLILNVQNGGDLCRRVKIKTDASLDRDGGVYSVTARHVWVGGADEWGRTGLGGECD
jgi:hypothetical protein